MGSVRAFVFSLTLCACGGRVESDPCHEVMDLGMCDPEQVNERCVEACGWLHCDGDVVMLGTRIELPDCRWKGDAGVAAQPGADPVCDELLALRVCNTLELGDCPTTTCGEMVWYRCPAQDLTVFGIPFDGTDCRWAKGSVR